MTEVDLFKLISEEYILLAAATYYLGTLIKRTAIKDENIPFILTAFSIVIVFMKELTGIDIQCERQMISVLSSSITHGLVVAMSAVYINQLIKQNNKKKID